LLLDGRIDDFSAVGDQAAEQDLVLKIESEALLFSIPVFVDQVKRLLEYMLLASRQT